MTKQDLAQLGAKHRDADFEHAGRVHEWRNYVPREVRAIWHELSDDARGVAYLIAEEAAGREEWD